MPTQRILLATALQSRDSLLSKDGLLTNCYTEIYLTAELQQQARIVKRPGYVESVALGGLGQGAFLFGLTTVFIAGDTLYTLASSYALSSPGPAGQSYQFTILPANGTTPAKLFFKNTTAAYIFDGSAVTKITDVNYPTTTVPGAAELDGTIYVMDTNSQIHGCNILDPLTWNALNFILADSEGDVPIAITRHLNYIVAFKQRSTQVFYDAGNPAPGSPLSPREDAFMEIGCSVAGSVALSDNTVFFMSNSFSNGRSVQKLMGMSNQPISTPFIDRLLNADNLDTVWAYVYKDNGHVFYVLTLKSTGITLVYDDVTGEWHRWTHLMASAPVAATAVTDAITGITTVTSASHGLADGDPVTISGQVLSLTYVDSNTFTVIPAAALNGAITYTSYVSSYFPLIYYTAGLSVNYGLSETDATVCTLSTDTYYDKFLPIDLHIRTAIEDWGIMNFKRFNRIELVGDINHSAVLVRITDDDYQTWAEYRPIMLDDDRAQLRGCGSGRRRAHELRHYAGTPLRLIALELDFDVGVR